VSQNVRHYAWTDIKFTVILFLLYNCVTVHGEKTSKNISH